MTPKERLSNLMGGRPVDRPPFFPALYDYKAALAGKPSHLFGQTTGELLDALDKEVELLRAEVLTVAYDIYNIEAEALGAAVMRSESVVMPEIEAPLVTAFDEVDSLSPLSAPGGRMPAFIEAAAKSVEKYGETIPVRGGLSGPFSMAAKLYPREQLLMDTVMNPDGVKKLLGFCNEVIKVYAKGFVDAGAGVVVFDSFIAPPMVSPQIYEDLILTFHQDLFAYLESLGVSHRALIAGGDISPLLPALVKCGANQLLLDYSIAPGTSADLMKTHSDIVFRVNIDPGMIADSTADKVKQETTEILAKLEGVNNLILGTGILPGYTPQENILAVRDTLG